MKPGSDLDRLEKSLMKACAALDHAAIKARAANVKVQEAASAIDRTLGQIRFRHGADAHQRAVKLMTSRKIPK